MRDGAIVQLGTPEELVGAPADDYVEDFVRDVPKTHVLTLALDRAATPTPEDELDGPGVPVRPTVIRTAVHAAAATDKPIRVVDDGSPRRRRRPGPDPQRRSPAWRART